MTSRITFTLEDLSQMDVEGVVVSARLTATPQINNRLPRNLETNAVISTAPLTATFENGRANLELVQSRHLPDGWSYTVEISGTHGGSAVRGVWTGLHIPDADRSFSQIADALTPGAAPEYIRITQEQLNEAIAAASSGTALIADDSISLQKLDPTIRDDIQDSVDANQISISNRDITFQSHGTAHQTVTLPGETYTQPEKSKLAGITAGAQPNVGVEFTQDEKTKLDGIEAGASGDLTPEEIQDVVGGMVSGNTETDGDINYDDSGGKLNLHVLDGASTIIDARPAQVAFANAQYRFQPSLEFMAAVSPTAKLRLTGAGNTGHYDFTYADIAAHDPIAPAAQMSANNSVVWDGDNRQVLLARGSDGFWRVSSDTVGPMNLTLVRRGSELEDFARVSETDEVPAGKLPKASGSQAGIIGTDEYARIHSAIDGANLDQVAKLGNAGLANDDDILVHDTSITTPGMSQLRELPISEADKRWQPADWAKSGNTDQIPDAKLPAADNPSEVEPLTAVPTSVTGADGLMANVKGVWWELVASGEATNVTSGEAVAQTDPAGYFGNDFIVWDTDAQTDPVIAWAPAADLEGVWIHFHGAGPHAFYGQFDLTARRAARDKTIGGRQFYAYAGGSDAVGEGMVAGSYFSARFNEGSSDGDAIALHGSVKRWELDAREDLSEINTRIEAEVEQWARDATTPIPQSKLSNAPPSGLNQSQVDARVAAGVSNWAETGNTDAIPAGKLSAAPGADALNQTEVDARVREGVADWAETGNTDKIPDAKLPPVGNSRGDLLATSHTLSTNAVSWRGHFRTPEGGNLDNWDLTAAATAPGVGITQTGSNRLQLGLPRDSPEMGAWIGLWVACEVDGAEVASAFMPWSFGGDADLSAQSSAPSSNPATSVLLPMAAGTAATTPFAVATLVMRYTQTPYGTPLFQIRSGFRTGQNAPAANTKFKVYSAIVRGEKGEQGVVTDASVLDAAKTPRTTADRGKAIGVAADNENLLALLDLPDEIPSGNAFPASPEDDDRFQLLQSATAANDAALTPGDSGSGTQGQFGWWSGTPGFGHLDLPVTGLTGVVWYGTESGNPVALRGRVAVWLGATTKAPSAVVIAGTSQALTAVPNLPHVYRTAMLANPFGGSAPVRLNVTFSDSTKEWADREFPASEYAYDGERFKWYEDGQGAVAIRNKLQTLSGDARLSADYIKDIPARKFERLLLDGPVSGLSITNTVNTVGPTFTVIDPVFDLDDVENGEFDISVVWTVGTRAKTTIGLTADRVESYRQTDIMFATQLKAGASWVTGGALEGLEVATGDPVDVYDGADKLGNLSVRLARNSRGELGYVTHYEGGGTTSTNLSVGVRISISWSPTDAVDTGGVAFTQDEKTKLAGIQVGARAPQSGAAIVMKLSALTGTARLPGSAIRDLPSGGNVFPTVLKSDSTVRFRDLATNNVVIMTASEWSAVPSTALLMGVVRASPSPQYDEYTGIAVFFKSHLSSTDNSAQVFARYTPGGTTSVFGGAFQRINQGSPGAGGFGLRGRRDAATTTVKVTLLRLA